MAGVVITGASTGIGEATARRLAREGFTVFAGVRKPADAERLHGARIVPLMLDVTDAGAIAAAAGEVKRQLAGDRLAGLVNNAGIVVASPLETLDLDELRRQLEINSVAPVAVAQAFLPQLRASKGRIVNMSSIGGRVAQPFLGAYVMSKFALEAMTDALRRELLPWGIDVIAIEPGTIKTPLWDKGMDEGDRTLAALGEEGRALYGERLERLRGFIPKVVARGAPPEKVADVVHRALTARRPRTRYLVGDAWVQAAASAVLSARWLDRVMARIA
jgi:NAD(P)-dependent dehydrogenase (short-subunit alcohol dehydrogenase family)